MTRSMRVKHVQRLPRRPQGAAAVGVGGSPAPVAAAPFTPTLHCRRPTLPAWMTPDSAAGMSTSQGISRNEGWLCMGMPCGRRGGADEGGGSSAWARPASEGERRRRGGGTGRPISGRRAEAIHGHGTAVGGTGGLPSQSPSAACPASCAAAAQGCPALQQGGGKRMGGGGDAGKSQPGAVSDAPMHPRTP